MENNVDDLKSKIAENQSTLLGLYNDLVVCYEDSRQLYEAYLEDDDFVTVNPTEPVKCSGIFAVNKSATVTRWALMSLEGTMIYQSNKCNLNEMEVIDLREQHREIGMQCTLRANDVGKDSTSTVILEYDPFGPFAQFELRGSVFKTWINYKGTTNS